MTYTWYTVIVWRNTIGGTYMGITELILLAVGLSMDAFAVSICKGLAMPELKLRHMVTVGLWFGGFQALMPLIGYFLGTTFAGYITAVDHWIAFILLCIIGGNMIKEALADDDEEADPSLGVRIMLLLAIATSIDALAVGVTFAFLLDSFASVLLSALLIGCTTFIFSAAGVKVGNVFGMKYRSKAELVGGIILILLGIKILLEGLGVI